MRWVRSVILARPAFWDPGTLQLDMALSRLFSIRER